MSPLATPSRASLADHVHCLVPSIRFVSRSFHEPASHSWIHQSFYHSRLLVRRRLQSEAEKAFCGACICFGTSAYPGCCPLNPQPGRDISTFPSLLYMSDPPARNRWWDASRDDRSAAPVQGRSTVPICRWLNGQRLTPAKRIISAVVTVTQRIALVPPHAQQDDLGLKMTGGYADPAPRHLKGCKVFMEEVAWGSDSRYFCYLYQTNTRSCNTTLLGG